MEPVTVVAALSSLVSGVAQFQASQYQAAVAEMNADRMRKNSEMAVAKMQGDLQDAGIRQAEALGAQDARIGASGIAFTSPSVHRTKEAFFESSQAENARIAQAGFATSHNYKSAAAEADAAASAERAKGGFALAGGVLGAFSSYIGDAKPTAPSPFGPAKVPRPTYYRRPAYG